MKVPYTYEVYPARTDRLAPGGDIYEACCPLTIAEGKITAPVEIMGTLWVGTHIMPDNPPVEVLYK